MMPTKQDYDREFAEEAALEYLGSTGSGSGRGSASTLKARKRGTGVGVSGQEKPLSGSMGMFTPRPASRTTGPQRNDVCLRHRHGRGFPL
jgi:hypothetical protein